MYVKLTMHYYNKNTRIRIVNSKSTISDNINTNNNINIKNNQIIIHFIYFLVWAAGFTNYLNNKPITSKY